MYVNSRPEIDVNELRGQKSSLLEREFLRILRKQLDKCPFPIRRVGVKLLLTFRWNQRREKEEGRETSAARRTYSTLPHARRAPPKKCAFTQLAGGRATREGADEEDEAKEEAKEEGKEEETTCRSTIREGDSVRPFVRVTTSPMPVMSRAVVGSIVFGGR